MDPNATLELIRDHLAAGEIEDAQAAAADLLAWIDRGGFPPESLGLDATRTICTFVQDLGS